MKAIINQQHSQSDSLSTASTTHREINPINRIPRIKNLTYLSNIYRESPIIHNKQKITNLITEHYTTNGFTYLSTSLSLQELQCLHITISEEDFQEAFIQRSNIYTKFLNPQTSTDLSATLRTMLASALTAHSLSSHRANNLLVSLEAQMTYSSGKLNYAAVNAYIRSLDVDSRLQKQLLEIIDRITPKPGTTVNILNMNLGANEVKAEDRLSKDEAILLIQDRAQALLTDAENLEAVYAEHDIALSPSVTAIQGQEKGPLAIGPGNALVSEGIILDVDDDAIMIALDNRPIRQGA